MATTKTDSRSQSARSRARQAMADQLARAKQREAKLTAVFGAIDAREAAETALGDALRELRDTGLQQTELAEMTGLSTREVSSAIKSAENNENKSAEDTNTANETSESPAPSGDGEHHNP